MVSELQREVAQAVRDGTSLDVIERTIIDDAAIDEEQRAVLWLYADALRRTREQQPKSIGSQR